MRLAPMHTKPDPSSGKGVLQAVNSRALPLPRSEWQPFGVWAYLVNSDNGEHA